MGTGRRVQGHSFPMRPLGETTSQNSGSKRDMVSQTGLLRKMHPGIPTRNGSQFPNGAPRGNCDPEFELETGCGFQIEALWETVSHLEGGTGMQFPDGTSKTKLRWNSSWMGWLMPQIGAISPQVIEGLGCRDSYRWRSRKRKARRIQGRTETCLSSLSTAVLALPSERP